MSPKARMLFWALLLFGGAALGVWLDLRLFPELFFNPWWHLVSLVLGLYLLKLVRRAAATAGRTLARYGREGELPRFETNRLVRKGPYECMRHPMHLALFFFPLALALIIGSPSFILIVWPLEVLLMLALIKLVEEPEAIRKFGDEYRRYMAEVPGFNLRPDCLRRLLTDQSVRMGREGVLWRCSTASSESGDSRSRR